MLNLTGMYYKTLFVIGLLFQLIGQLLLAKGNDFVYAQKPIDFAHWFLLIGAALLIPQIGLFPKKIYTYIGVPIIIIGIVSIIGMCVLDFIWWSQPTQEVRNEFASQISKVPSIWKPFITTTPKFINMGLFLLSLNYLRENKLGVSIVVLATIIKLFGWSFIPYSLVYVYLFTFIGFIVIFYKNPKKKFYA